jgi:anti-sigma regulatory factor (Ser/Thr protein kinase)
LAVTVRSRGDLRAQRGEISAWLRRHTDDRRADDVLLAAGEALDNALEHGRPPVVVEVSSDGGGAVTVVVRDSGRWVGDGPAPSRGRGFPIMRALMDDVTVDTSDGTSIVLSIGC